VTVSLAWTSDIHRRCRITIISNCVRAKDTAAAKSLPISLDARKYRKTPYLVMLKKVEKWSWIYIRNRINTKFNQFYVYGVTPCPCLPRLVDIMVVKNINVKIKKHYKNMCFIL